MQLPFWVEEIVAQERTPHRRWFRRLSEVDRGAISRAAELTGISSLLDRKMNELSGGEQQGVKLAIAIAQQASMLLLDEPLQHLDIAR